MQNYTLLEELLNEQFEQVHWEGEKALPAYLASQRSFTILKNNTSKFLIVTLPQTEVPRISTLRFQLQQFVELAEMPVAFELESVTLFLRNALVHEHIPFIALPTQVYLPFLGTHLQNSFRKQQSTPKEKMAPATQLLFLYLLYLREGESVTQTQAASALSLTKMTVSRGVEELDQMELITKESKGVSNRIQRNGQALPLLKCALPHMNSPVQSTHRVFLKDIEQLPISGETALAEYTMMNPPSVPYYACGNRTEIRSRIKELEQPEYVSDGVGYLEVWKYDPAPLAQKGIADVVSVYLSLQNIPNERMEWELENMLEVYPWQ